MAAKQGKALKYAAVTEIPKCDRLQVPYLVDPNTGTTIQDSEEAVAYLFRQYGRNAPASAT